MVAATIYVTAYSGITEKTTYSPSNVPLGPHFGSRTRFLILIVENGQIAINLCFVRLYKLNRQRRCFTAANT